MYIHPWRWMRRLTSSTVNVMYTGVTAKVTLLMVFIHGMLWVGLLPIPRSEFAAVAVSSHSWRNYSLNKQVKELYCFCTLSVGKFIWRHFVHTGKFIWRHFVHNRWSIFPEQQLWHVFLVIYMASKSHIVVLMFLWGGPDQRIRSLWFCPLKVW